MKAIEISKNITRQLKDGPKSFFELKQEIEEQILREHLENLEYLGRIKKIEHKYYIFQRNTYFNLYIKNKDSELLNTMYNEIKDKINEYYEKNPTKTQVYWIMWKINKELSLKLPIGLYIYGPCSVQIYKNEEPFLIDMPRNITDMIKKYARKLGNMENFELDMKARETKIYDLRNKIINERHKNSYIKHLIREMMKLAPDDTKETLDNFIVVMDSWKTDEIRYNFRHVWKFIAMSMFRDSLEFYYGDNLKHYLDDRITSRKESILEHQFM